MHFATQLAMTPYYFATNHFNYARWVPMYRADMTQLPPEIEHAFQSGQFAIRRTVGRFNGIWSDMGTKTTVIRDAKSAGGVVGLTRKQPALMRWMLTRHHLGKYGAAMNERSGHEGASNPSHEQTRDAAMQRDDSHARAMISHLENNMTHPFRPDDHVENVLLNISSGMLATPDVQNSLPNAVESGEQHMNKFIEGALSAEGQRSFFAPVSKNKLLTFTDMLKPTAVKIQGKTI